MIATQPVSRRQDVARILEAVKASASRQTQPALAVLVGLPASGKSRVAEELRARTGAVVLESDALRRLLFRRRTYSALESERLFAAIHTAIDRLLAEGVSAVLDATNLTEAERAPLCEIAQRHSAGLMLIHVTAPDRLARRRLARREAAAAGYSEAGLRVYERMRGRAEEIQRPHRMVDTSRDIEAAVAAITKEMLEL